MYKRYLQPFMVIIMMSMALFSSCGKEAEIQFNLELPSTPILSSRSRYALIISTHLRLRESPGLDGKVKETLWKGSILEVVGKSSARVVVENQEGYWYQVSYDGLQGYVFGGYLRFFSSREAAEEMLQDQGS